MAPDPKNSENPSPVIIDRALLRARRRRALALGASTFLLDRVAEELADRLASVLRTFPCGLDLGTPSDAVRRALAGSGKVDAIVAAAALVEAQPGPSALAIASDEEALPIRDGSLDRAAPG